MDKMEELQRKIEVNNALTGEDMVLVRQIIEEIRHKIKYHQNLSVLEQKILQGGARWQKKSR